MILIVDDKQENLFALRTTLEQHGFSTDTANSGEEALKKVLKREYALIILDVQMPVMDGFEVAEAITGLNKTRDIPIIFLSAVNTHKKFITKGFEFGAVDYLTKPVDPDILILKVRNFYRLYEKTAALKAAEKALSTTVNELQNMLESLPQLAFSADRQGAIALVNKRWYEFARSKDEFPQTQPGTPSLKELWLKHIRTGKEIELEVSIKKLDDAAFYYHLLRASPVSTNGVISRWVGTITNIHEQKMLNEVLERKVGERTRELLEINRELEISNSELQQFTFVASHDLKEPLRKIQLFGTAIRDGVPLEGTMSMYLDKLIQSSERMNKLVNDLLSFAGLTEPKWFETADLSTIIQEILIDLELPISEKEAKIHIQQFPTLDVIPGLIRQVFQNIISNALKFSKPGVPPEIMITSDLIEQPSIDSAANSSGPYCRITITDNGIGFDQQYADKIFTIFQRLHPRAEYEGTGIGLAIAKKIIDKHNGIISAHSKLGEGATFTIILPLKQAPAAAVEETSTLSSLK